MEILCAPLFTVLKKLIKIYVAYISVSRVVLFKMLGGKKT